MSNELEDFISNNAASFDDRMPDPAVLQRIQQQMAKEGPAKKGIVLSMAVVRWAAACLILLAGLGAVYMLQNHVTEAPKATASVTASPATGPSLENTPIDSQKTETPIIAKTEIGHPHFDEELSARKQVLFAKLKDMGSPSRRVTAAGEFVQIKNADRDIVDALVHTMNADPNTNVRLAALDALTRFHRESYVKQQLVRSLKKQTDPMVQIQLIQLLTRMRETSIVNQLEKMVKDDNTMDAVKDNAYSGILFLKS